MKKIFTVFLFIAITAGYKLQAQVQIDRPVILNGSSAADRQIQGIQTIANSQDAVNVDAVQKNSLLYGGAATGTAGAYTVSLIPAPSGSTLTTGMVVQFVANSATTSSGATLTITGLTPAAVAINKNYNSALVANDIQSGQAVSVIYDGSNFQMLSQLGTSGSSAAPHGKQLFTSNGTFTVPAGVTNVLVSISGGGGGGTFGAGGGGGGAAAYMLQPFTLTLPSYAVAVGVGGFAGAPGVTGQAGIGGTSSFGSLISAAGGTGGDANGFAGVSGGTNGNDGMLSMNVGSQIGGAGGGSLFGAGGAGGLPNGKGGNGSGYGGGGGSTGSSSFNGGTGAPGFVLVEW